MGLIRCTGISRFLVRFVLRTARRIKSPKFCASWRSSRDAEIRHYGVPLSELFKIGTSEYPTVGIDANVMGGAPCIAGTRIPVYMILDAIEAGGGVHAALESYPRLTEQQVRDAVGFAKVLVECPLEQEAPSASR